MICPKCSTEYSGNICPKCDTDGYLFKKAKLMSDKLYNRGLAKLRSGDIYYGIKYLEKAVSFNKNSIHARNLLGLALLEVGHAGDALHHWLISHSKMPEKNPGLKFSEEVFKDTDALDKMNEAIVFFNSAFDKLCNHEAEHAIRDLKRAIESNPKLIDAYNMLALCYMAVGMEDEAGECVKTVLKNDRNNPVARNYYSILFPEEPDFKPANNELPVKSKTAKAPENSEKSQPKPEEKPKKQPLFKIGEAVGYVLGATCVLLVFLLIVLPIIDARHESDIFVLETDILNIEMTYEELLDDAAEEMERRAVRIAELQDANQVWATAHARMLAQFQVNDAYILYRNNDIHGMFAILDDIDAGNVPELFVERYDELMDAAYPVMADFHYRRGLEHFNNREYEQATTPLVEALRFMSGRESLGVYETGEEEEVPPTPEWIHLLFMLGVLNYESGFHAEAYDYFMGVRQLDEGHEAERITQILESIASAHIEEESEETEEE